MTMNYKKKYFRELGVGLLGILALFIIYLLINFFKGVNVLDEGNKYYIEFDNIGEIYKTTPVYLNGYKVGNVSNISYDFEKAVDVCVEISVDARLKIPRESYAIVNTKILGSGSINLVLATGENFIQPGDTIKGHLDAGALGEAGNMIPKVDDMLPKVDSILTSLNTILANPAINKSVNNIELLTRQLNATTAQINSLISGDINEAAGKLVEIEEDLLTVSSQLSQVDYTALMASLEESINNIQQITDALNNGEGTAGLLLKDSTLYNNLNATCESATALLEDLRNNPKRYVHFSVFGSKSE